MKCLSQQVDVYHLKTRCCVIPTTTPIVLQLMDESHEQRFITKEHNFFDITYDVPFKSNFNLTVTL